jgi:transposase
MVRRHEITDEAWAKIAPLLPESGRRNGRWCEHRQVLDGICWKLATGAPWRDIPERYGPWKTCHDRLRRWTADGTWDRILAHVQVHNDGAPVEWTVHVDSTSIRAHQHAAGARKKGGAAVDGWAPGRAPGAVAAHPGEALGRSRGGLTTKLHLAADGRGRPLTIVLTEGQAGDNPQLVPLLDAICWRTGRVDQEDWRTRQGSRGGRPPAFDREAYRQRNVVERCFNRLKQNRAPATRYATRAAHYRGRSHAPP